MNNSSNYTLIGSAAERYERNMVPAIFLPFAEDLLERVALQEGEQVLDVACGTGIVSRLAWAAVAPSGTVTGLDVNPKMLEVAQEVTRKENIPIEWREGDAANMPFRNGQFDVVICQRTSLVAPDMSAFRGKRADSDMPPVPRNGPALPIPSRRCAC
jgi:2-polyprenyl-3-methyl-5-hydroxy-6-metoxy-1,4-benzoquinol methylase